MKLAILFGGTVLLSPLVLAGQSATPLADQEHQPVLYRMINPALDKPNEPFSYPSNSTDQISVMHAPSGAEITPEGSLYTGFGELVFFAGMDREPVAQRIRTLEKGYLPIVSYEVEHDKLRYRFTFFAASLGPEQTGEDVVNFVRVAILNPTGEPRSGFLTTAWRYQGNQTTTFHAGDNRFRRPAAGNRVGDYQQPGEVFRPDSVYAVVGNAYLRDRKAIYFFPQADRMYLSPSYRDYYNRTETTEKAATVLPTTPMAAAEYEVPLAPGAARTLEFKVPLLPVAVGDPEFQAIDQAQFDERKAKVEEFWDAILARGMKIETPEEKVNLVFKTSLVNDLMALNKIGNDYVQTINQLQYHGFYLRDSADFVRMYDTSGYTDIGRQIVNFFAARQQSDGNFLSQPGQFDGWGEALWTYGEHYRMTHDKAFAAEVYPRVQRAVMWLQNATAADPLHIMPSTDVRDNEYIPGHLTGYNFLALDGLQAAILFAHDLGHADDEKRFRALEQELRRNFMKQLDAVTERTGGYIPPALDGDMGGTDWGNLLSLTPEQQLSPFDPRVAATLKATRAKYAEGLITYRQPDQGTYLHHYLTIKNTLTELIRGEQQQAIRELYAVLLHTSSTNAGWEYSIRPWGDRDFSGNLAPHGWFAAEYRNLLRNMMVREEGSSLHLFSAVSPEWLAPGKAIEVQDALTYFGKIGFELHSVSDSEANLEIHPAFDPGREPQRIVVHVPWFLHATAVSADGVSVPVVSGAIQLPPTTKTVSFKWVRDSLPPDMPKNYADAVERYKHEYKQRYERLTNGKQLEAQHSTAGDIEDR
jgi:hypothetical protein